jgi:hypothetical protein
LPLASLNHVVFLLDHVCMRASCSPAYLSPGRVPRFFFYYLPPRLRRIRGVAAERGGAHPILRAAKVNGLKCVTMLVSKGANVDARCLLFVFSCGGALLGYATPNS